MNLYKIKIGTHGQGVFVVSKSVEEAMKLGKNDHRYNEDYFEGIDLVASEDNNRNGLVVNKENENG